MPRLSSSLVLFALAFLILTPLATGQAGLTQTLPQGLSGEGLEPNGLAAPLPAGFNTGGTNLVLGRLGDERLQWIYDSSHFEIQGPIVITDVRVRSITTDRPISAFTATNLTVTLSSSPNDVNPAGSMGQPGFDVNAFANNVGTDATVMRSGPFTGAANPASFFAPFGPWFSFQLTNTFVYDPSLGLDLLIDVERCGVTQTWGPGLVQQISGDVNVTGINSIANVSTCGAPGPTFVIPGTNTSAPLVLIEYQPAAAFTSEYQTDQPAASLRINGGLGSILDPLEVLLPINQFQGNLTFDSSAPGSPWDLVFNNAPLVSRTAGAVTTPSGNQLVNVDLTMAPTLLNSGFMGAPFTPISLPLNVTAPIPVLSAQLAVVNALSPDGLSLSQPLQLAFQ